VQILRAAGLSEAERTAIATLESAFGAQAQTRRSREGLVAAVDDNEFLVIGNNVVQAIA
jgi:hypothetical protein